MPLTSQQYVSIYNAQKRFNLFIEIKLYAHYYIIGLYTQWHPSLQVGVATHFKSVKAANEQYKYLLNVL